MIGAIIAKHKINKAFENLNNRNLDAFLDGWSDDGVFKYPGNLSVSGDIEGLPAVKKWFQNMLNQYPKIQFKIHHICVENIFDMVGTNTLIAYWSVSLTNKEGVSVQNLGTNMVKIKQRRVIEVQDFFFYPERLPIGWGESTSG